MTQPRRDRLSTEVVDGVTVVSIESPQIIDDLDNLALQEVRAGLYSLVAEGGARRLLVNLSKVEYASTEFYASLVVLKKRIEAAGGSIKFCCLQADVAEILKIMGLNRVFLIYPDEQSALDSF